MDSVVVGARHAELGQFDDAWRRIREAMVAVETTKQKRCEADIHRMAGEIALISPQPDSAKAEVYFERALFQSMPSCEQPGAEESMINLTSFATALILGLITLGGTAHAEDKGTVRPNVKVGDQWMFVLRSNLFAKLFTKLEYAWVVTSVSLTKIEGTENGKPLVLTPDLNIIVSPQEKNSDDRLLNFPLKVGKQWSYGNDYVLDDISWGHLDGHNEVRVAVLGYEKVRVPAGEFDAFKLEAKGNWVSPQASIPGESDVTYWYAPAVRAIVKKERQASHMPTYTTELVEFHLQP